MRCPFPYYWMCHMVIALGIAVVVWPFLGLYFGLLCGALFYIVRETIQGIKLKYFDWRGVAAPVGLMIALAVLVYKITEVAPL